jgi:RHH-type transcriptional regulator, rel operon repressor / antitoxin RelB
MLNMQATLTERPLSIKLPFALADQLDALTETMGQSKTALTIEALSNYIETQMWQLADVKTAVCEADNGEFATETEVNDFFKKYGC